MRRTGSVPLIRLLCSHSYKAPLPMRQINSSPGINFDRFLANRFATVLVT